MIGIAADSVTAPVAESACRIPTDAELDWMIPVSSAPTRTPSIGFLKAIKRFVNAGTF